MNAAVISASPSLPRHENPARRLVRFARNIVLDAAARPQTRANLPGAAASPASYAAGMDLRRLASFLAVAEEGHFGKAAARLFRSPASVTAHVQQLERELGARLLDRSPVRLTPAGERFIGHASPQARGSSGTRDPCWRR
ncbi:LysR family transcriptional regulator [Saccharopolyspora spinosa]|uniref:LysR family transcriptional regulator n=1 Tax=Saccharopolyspora spinosa TaxID=60894 RepID=UPI001ED900C7|nr:LysR family transcriptional regulator [Saccharopolyspora spinosa]